MHISVFPGFTNLFLQLVCFKYLTHELSLSLSPPLWIYVNDMLLFCFVKATLCKFLTLEYYLYVNLETLSYRVRQIQIIPLCGLFTQYYFSLWQVQCHMSFLYFLVIFVVPQTNLLYVCCIGAHINYDRETWVSQWTLISPSLIPSWNHSCTRLQRGILLAACTWEGSMVSREALNNNAGARLAETV